MRRTRGRTIEVDTLEELDRRLAAGAERLTGWQLQGLDLSARSQQLSGLDLGGALFLGCRFPLGGAERARRQGALVFPALPGVPVDGYRGTLYSPEELYEGLEQGYAATLDGRAYAWSRHPGDVGPVDHTLATALHDHAIGGALVDWVAGRSLVGVMGGHATRRGTPEYRDAARLGRRLSDTHVVATGGGPGAMEAANLGAWLSAHEEGALDQALDLLAGTTSYRPSVEDWVRAGFEIRRRWPGGADSLGVPTWFYGHEPPNVFASAIAKYFANALREDVLLHLATGGVVFLPGAAGTVQEVFQEACENYYADPSAVAPMVLVGRRHWTEELPVHPLLARLADGRPMAPQVHLVDSVDEAADLLAG